MYLYKELLYPATAAPAVATGAGAAGGGGGEAIDPLIAQRYGILRGRLAGMAHDADGCIDEHCMRLELRALGML